MKEKYDRHFLLLCLLSTVFIKIRGYTDTVLSPYTDWDKIRIFSTPKLLRFIEILEKFQPAEDKKAEENRKEESRRENVNKMLNDIDKCDFLSLSNKIEDQVNIMEANLKEIIIDNPIEDEKKGDIHEDTRNINKENKDSDKCRENVADSSDIKSDSAEKSSLWFPKRQGGRARGRGRVPRNNAARVLQMQQNPDALCGIVFMKEALMAKTMFLLMVVS